MPVILSSLEGPGPNPPTNPTGQVNSYSFAGPTTTPQSALIYFETLSDYGNLHTDLGLSDTQGNSWALLDQENTSRTGGAQTIASWLALNTKGGANTYTQALTSTGDTEDYQAGFIVEVGGITASPLLGHSGSTQNALAPGQNAIQSGLIAVSSAQCPCVLVGLGFNTSASGTPVAPTPGTGMTQLATCFGFHILSPGASVVYQYINAPGSYQALFNQASSHSEDCCSAALILQGTSIRAQLMLAGVG